MLLLAFRTQVKYRYTSAYIRYTFDLYLYEGYRHRFSDISMLKGQLNPLEKKVERRNIKLVTEINNSSFLK
jgi:hypothetical protein